ncbi:MAG: hypothetical protein JNJ69_08655 [Leptospiraceae bacterium]|nr:hypothetical protein [Leptospiraceae bacterium]
MKYGLISICCFVLVFAGCAAKNQFTFCRDFNPDGCIEPQKDTITFSLEKTQRQKTIRDFYNSIYFRGDRVAFALLNSYSKYPVTFECLGGYYVFPESPREKHELEYIELRDNHVYGLVMVGAMIEKKFPERKHERYTALPPFAVTYKVLCGKDLMASATITVKLQ